MQSPQPDFFFFFNDPATTEIYTLSLHDALPISMEIHGAPHRSRTAPARASPYRSARQLPSRSEEHTSELQSRFDLVCRLLLENKKIIGMILAPLQLILAGRQL